MEVTSNCYIDESKIWEGEEQFPCRFTVKPVYMLNPKTAVPVLDMRDRLTIFENLKSDKYWSGFFRGSPAEYQEKDAKIILEEIKKASLNPIERPYNELRYKQQHKLYKTPFGPVTIPDYDDEPVPDKVQPNLQNLQSIIEQGQTGQEKITHEEIQYLLLKLGSDLGLDVWVARNDRNRQYNGTSFKDIPHIRSELPRQFDDTTNSIIELIDVLWLKKDAIIAAFEVENTTSIYSGLLRMSDLVSMQPNIKLDLYIVAPDQRHDNVYNEINRPTFTRLDPPLTQICRYISYSELKQKLKEIGPIIKHLKHEFIKDIAESCIPEDI